ncbi:MAG TPA: hypothetical protein VN153_07595 [Tahibacter sp.]|nr:hypothetical protein [Tahibacter sp.]
MSLAQIFAEQISVGADPIYLSGEYAQDGEDAVVEGLIFPREVHIEVASLRDITFRNCKFDRDFVLRNSSCDFQIGFQDCEFLSGLRFWRLGGAGVEFHSCTFHRGFEIVPSGDEDLTISFPFSVLKGVCVIGHRRFFSERLPIRSLGTYHAVIDKESSLEIYHLSCTDMDLGGLILREKAAVTLVNVRGKERHSPYRWLNFQDLKTVEKASIALRGVALYGVRLGGTNLEKVDFSESDWPVIDGRSGIHDEIDLRQGIAAAKNPGDLDVLVGKMERTAESYRQLVVNFEAKRNYELAESFHVGEMEMARLKAEAAISKRVGRWARCLNGYRLYRFLSKYGTSYHRAASVLVVLLLGFSVLFLFNGYKIRDGGAVNYDIAACERCQRVSLADVASDYSGSLAMTLSIATLQKERHADPSGATGSILSTAVLVVVSAQLALLLFAIRRRFRRASV